MKSNGTRPLSVGYVLKMFPRFSETFVLNEILALIADGFLDQVLISHDLCMKHRLWKWGGPGYSHILDNVVPLMREKGFTEEQIQGILVENPRRLMQVV